MDLFRKEAVLAKSGRNSVVGHSIVLKGPRTEWIVPLLSGGIALFLLSFLLFGTYAKKSTAYGEVFSNKTPVKIYTPEKGIITEIEGRSGQYVKKGSPLFRVSAEKTDSMNGGSKDVKKAIDERERNFHAVIERSEQLNAVEVSVMERNLKDLRLQLKNIDNQLVLLKGISKSVIESITRYEALVAKEYLPKEQLDQKKREALEIDLRSSSLEFKRQEILGEISKAEGELASKALKSFVVKSELRRSIDQLAQEKIENAVKSNFQILAPESGRLVGIQGTIGDLAAPDKPLALIVPQPEILHAVLYLTSKSVGDVKAGKLVFLRFQAYPHQKYGGIWGVVETISEVALSPAELVKGNAELATSAFSQEKPQPLYTAKVRFNVPRTNQKTLRESDLRLGMLLEADIFTERRRLYEWALDPLSNIFR